jgi:hypothetical protein
MNGQQLWNDDFVVLKLFILVLSSGNYLLLDITWQGFSVYKLDDIFLIYSWVWL